MNLSRALTFEKNIGLQARILTQTTFTMFVLMALVSVSFLSLNSALYVEL